MSHDEKATGPVRDWHVRSTESVADYFQTSLSEGLSLADALERQKKDGFNELSAKGGPTWIKVLAHQLVDAMNWIFIALAIVSYVFGDYPTGTMLLFIALLNLYLSFSQEYAAEQTLAALRNLSSPMANVLRDGRDQMIPSREIVPGDILLVKEGDSVAADARLFHTSNLEVDEALLTGESVPVQKELVTLEDPDEPLGDRVNMLYSSTVVSKGRGRAIVTATAMHTEIGKVAKKLADAGDSDRTRLQKALNKMYIVLMCAAVLCVIIVLASVKFKADYDIGMYAMTAAMSVLPAGLTTVLTVTLVLGGKEMTQQKAVVRKLKCLETLGSVTNIFSDKTGTLTMAKMVVIRFWMPDEGYFYVTPKGLAPEGDVYRTEDLSDKSVELSEGERLDKTSISDRMQRLIECSALCNMSSIFQRRDDPNVAAEKDKEKDKNADEGDWISSGAPTEVALQVFAHKFNQGKPQLEAMGWELLAEYQFDSTIKRMSTLCYNPKTNDRVIFTKGAAERILPLCHNAPKNALDVVERLAAKGLRVMALACRNADENVTAATKREELECDLQFLGLTGIYDPPRNESRTAVAEAHAAGISVHMLTGDHEITARAIAKEINILPADVPAAAVMTGPQFDALSDEEIDKLPLLPLVVARCSPETKVKMIQASHRRRNISAMTGDGVNDSPSLRIADVGISMGKNGSDVAKQASDIILTDDNFATIIRAIAEGRRIYQNMQRFLLYYWIIVLGLAVLVLVCLAVRDPTGNSVAPMSTIQMVLIFVAVTPPAADLSVQAASPTVMKEPPRPPTESIFNREIIMDTFVYGLGITVLCLIAFLVPLYVHSSTGVGAHNCDTNYQPGLCDSLYIARGSMLTAFLFASLIAMIHCRSYRTSQLTRKGMLQTIRSRVVVGTFFFDLICLVIFMYIPAAAIEGFSMLGITWEWGLAIGLDIAFLIYGEVYKAIKRRFMKPLERPQVIAAPVSAA